MQNGPRRTLGGSYCDIPNWVQDCIRSAIDNFNRIYPPMYADYTAPGRGPLPGIYGQQLTRQNIFIGRSAEPSVLAYADCSDAARAQMLAIARAYGGPGDFEGYIGAETGATFTVFYTYIGGRPQQESIFVPGVYPENVPDNYMAVGECGTPPSVTPSPGGRRTSPYPGERRITGPIRFRSKWGFVGDPTQLCPQRRPTRDEIDTIREAYRRASMRVPPTRTLDDVERTRLDRAWFNELMTFPGMPELEERLFNDRDSFLNFLDQTRGSTMDGFMDVERGPSSLGAIPADRIDFRNWILVRQCPWDPP